METSLAKKVRSVNKTSAKNAIFRQATTPRQTASYKSRRVLSDRLNVGGESSRLSSGVRSADFVDIVRVANDMDWRLAAQPVERAVSENAIQNVSSHRDDVSTHDDEAPGGMNDKINTCNSTPPDAIVFRVCRSEIEVSIIGDLLVLNESPQLNQPLPPIHV